MSAEHLYSNSRHVSEAEPRMKEKEKKLCQKSIQSHFRLSSDSRLSFAKNCIRWNVNEYLCVLETRTFPFCSVVLQDLSNQLLRCVIRHAHTDPFIREKEAKETNWQPMYTVRVQLEAQTSWAEWNSIQFDCMQMKWNLKKKKRQAVKGAFEHWNRESSSVFHARTLT